MRYSIKSRERIYVKGSGFLSFAENIGKNLSNKYSQKPLDNAKKSTTDAIETASQRAIQKTSEATGDLIGNKIADKITSVSNLQRAQKMMMLIVNQKDQKKDTYLLKKDNKLLMN